MKQQKLSLLIVIGLFLINFAGALDFSTEMNSNVIVKDFNNPVELTIHITGAVPGDYNVYTLADVSLEPRGIFKITEPKLTRKFTITPTENLEINGLYTLTYTLNHRDVEQIDKKLVLKLVNLEDIIEIGSESIMPENGSNTIEFYIKNKENVYIKNVTAKFSSVLFKTEKTFSLKPYEILNVKVEVKDNKLAQTKAGAYIIDSTWQTNEGDVEIQGNMFIGEKKGIATTEDKSGLLIQTETINKINAGNVLETVQVNLTRNIVSRLFTSFNVGPTFTEREGLTIKYLWIKDGLGPSEVYTVKATTNYVFPFLAVVLGVFLFFGFKRFSQTKVEVIKSASHVRTKNSLFALKIKISIKATKDIENVTLIDKVPPIVKIYEKFGMLKPDKIDPESRRLHWHIGDLKAGEERIFTYVIYSKVGVVGKFSLPEALAVFEKDGKIQEVNSNRFYFMSGQVSKE